MASLRFKKDGTPFVDFRWQGKRLRPEFLSAKEAIKFQRFADANPAEAYQLWQESVIEQESSVTAPVTMVSLKEKVECFKTDYCSKRCRASDMRFHITRFRDFVINHASQREGYVIEDVDLRRVVLEDFEAFQTKLVKNGLSNSSVNRNFATIKTFFKRAFRAQYTSVDYAALIETLPVESVQREAWISEDTPRLISELVEREADQVLIDIVQSMAFSPFGPIDFARLQWRAVNFEVGEINTFRMKGRGRREWNVPLILGYQALLLEIRRRHEAAGFGKPSDYVYLDKCNKPVIPGWVSKSLERARKSVGITQVPYSSRHRIITLVAEKTDRDTASRFAGHASVRTTEKHYLVGGNENFRNKIKEALR